MNDEDFKQTMLDYFSFEQQRHRDIMAILTDVQANNAAIKTEVATLVANTKTMLAELAATGHAGHSAVLDQIAAEQTDVIAAVKSAGAEIATEFKAVQLPGAPPA